MTLTRQDLAPEARRPFHLYLDEFHAVATASMASLFTGARKYRLGVVVAHQDLYQLHGALPEVERAVLGNAYTRIVFRVGDEDARALERGFSSFEAADLTRLGLGEAICRIGGSAQDFNLRTLPRPDIDPAEARERREAVRAIAARRWDAEPERAPERQAAAPAPARETAHPPKTEPPVPRRSPPAAPASERAPQQPQLDKEQLDYLELVATDPFLSVRERNESLGLSAWKGQRVKTALLEAGLVREVAVNPAAGASASCSSSSPDRDGTSSPPTASRSQAATGGEGSRTSGGQSRSRSGSKPGGSPRSSRTTPAGRGWTSPSGREASGWRSR